MHERIKAHLQKLTPEEMPTRDLNDVAKVFGVETTLKLVENFGGSYLYIPSEESFKQSIEKFIKENYTGHNERELAKVCNCSTRTILRAIGKKESVSKDIVSPDQQILSLV